MTAYAEDGQRIDIEFYCPACGETYPCRVDPKPYLLAPGSETFQCPGCKTTFRIYTEYEDISEERTDQ